MRSADFAVRPVRRGETRSFVYPEGEVDFVASGRLTEPGWQWATVESRDVRLEIDVEIVAKKLYYRGDRFKARDVFDLAMLLEREPSAAAALRSWAERHRDAMIALLDGRAGSLRTVYDIIDARSFRATFDGATASVRAFLAAVPRPRPPLTSSSACRPAGSR